MDDRLDENVVRACRQGDTASYALLVKRHYRHVFAVCLGILGNIHDAEDIAQDARNWAEASSSRHGLYKSRKIFALILSGGEVE